MPNNLYEVLQSDMKAYPLQDEVACKVYLRTLLGDAYLGRNSHTNVYNYVRMHGTESVRNEIMQMIYQGEKYLNYASLLDSVTEQIFPQMMQVKKNHSSMNNAASANCICSFMEVMHKTLTYYSEKGQFNKEDSDAVMKCAHLILSNYFKSNRPSVFSSKNGTRAYVLSQGKDKVFNEIKKELNMDKATLDELITAYALKASSSFLSKNDALENPRIVR